jgi:hypothetical protein
MNYWKSCYRFERLRQEQPDAISRIVAYEGNLVYENLGTQRQDREAMANVTVVFHTAGPSEYLLNFCRELPKLCAVVMASNLSRFTNNFVYIDLLFIIIEQ